MEKILNIAFITDDNYMMPTCVALKSLIDNFESLLPLKIHICSFGLAEEHKKKFEDYSQKDRKIEVVVHCINEANYRERFSKIDQNTHVTSTALLKFELPNIIPDTDKILYLDGDIIVKRNIAELFNYDISDYLLAASFEYWKYLINYYNNADKSVPAFYFNSGVMLLNCERFKKEGIIEKLWQIKFEQFNNGQNKSKLMDQDVFNTVCKDRVLQLPIKFNCNCAFSNNVDVDSINKIFNTTYKTSQEIKPDAIVIHYVGKEDKPWKYINRPCQKEWDYYYEKTGFSLQELKRTNRKLSFSDFIKKLSSLVKEKGLFGSCKYILRKV